MTPLPPRSPWRVREPRRSPEPGEGPFLVEDGTNALPVRIVIEQNGFVTGWDDGALGFDKDSVWFSGECCSFRIAARDLLIWESSDAHHSRTLAPGIPIRHPSRKVWIRLILRVHILGRSHAQDRLMDEIMRLRNRKGGGESEYPPLVPRPGAAVWRPKTTMLPPPGSAGPIASFLERTGLSQILASDLSVFYEMRQRARLLREIAYEEER